MLMVNQLAGFGVVSVDQVTTIPVGANWAGDTGLFSFGSGTANSADNSAVYGTSDLTGDFIFQATLVNNGSGDGWTFGVFDSTEVGSFPVAPLNGNWGSSFTDSWWFNRAAGPYYGSADQGAFVPAGNDVVKIQRSGSTITLYRNGASVHAFSQTFSGAVRPSIGSGNGLSDFSAISWTT